eukprot:scaffold2678_cov140-Isochrysis_galbana.AAC.6
MLVLDRSGSVKNCFWRGPSNQMDCDQNSQMTHNEMYYFAREIIGGFELGEGTAQFGVVDFDSASRNIVSVLTHDSTVLDAGLELCEDDADCRAAFPNWVNTGQTIREYNRVGPLSESQRANGWTSISNGMALGRELLVNGNTRRDPISGAAPKRIMLLLTDGEQTCVRSSAGAVGAWTMDDGGRYTGSNTCSNTISDDGTGDAEAIAQAAVLKASTQDGGDDVTLFAVGFGSANPDTIAAMATNPNLSFFGSNITAIREYFAESSFCGQVMVPAPPPPPPPAQPPPP